MSSNNITGLNDKLELLYAYTLKNNFIYYSLTLFQGFEPFNRSRVRYRGKLYCCPF